MSDFRKPLGFEEALRPPINTRRARITRPVLRPPGVAGDAAAYAQLARIIRRTPEVVVKVTGRTADSGHLLRHLDYISRNGKLVLEGQDGERHAGREMVKMLAAEWGADHALDPGRRADSPVSRSIVLSMPPGTDPLRLNDAARAFAAEAFGERFPYVFALHDEDGRPHVHLTVRTLGSDGMRLNPRKADLEVWRQRFAQALRDRGIEAEASPRRARGIKERGEPTAVRKSRERLRAEDPGKEASAVKKEGAAKEMPHEIAARARQARILRALGAEAVALASSDRAEDNALSSALVKHVEVLAKARSRERLLSTDRDRSGGSDR